MIIFPSCLPGIFFSYCSGPTGTNVHKRIRHTYNIHRSLRELLFTQLLYTVRVYELQMGTKAH